jgi:hypothetical protein
MTDINIALEYFTFLNKQQALHKNMLKAAQIGPECHLFNI